jgi:hypothetical protein
MTQPGTWYAGTSPQGLFRSNDGGVTWEPFSYINNDPQYREWMGSVQDGTPDGPKLNLCEWRAGTASCRADSTR